MTTSTSFPGLTSTREPITGTLAPATLADLRSFFRSERYDREALESNLEWARSGRWFSEECETIDPADIDAANDVLWMGVELHGTTPAEIETEPVKPLATITARSFGLEGWRTSIARTWPENARYCGRCPRGACTLTGGTCLVLATGFIDDRDAAEFRRIAL